MIFKWLFNLFKDKSYKQKIKHAKSMDYHRIEDTALETIIREELPGVNDILIMDRYFLTTNLGNIQWFLDHDDTDKYEYIPEVYDCDNFAIRLYGQFNIPYWSAVPVGFIIIQMPKGTYHAMNIFVDENGEVYIIEPQNDQIYLASDLIDDGWKPYFVMF